MVHSTNSKCAEMANRLTAINRWCITGTPIGRSLTDLHGLFNFIKEDPYMDERWFKYFLYDPFKNGDKLPMAKAVSSVLWRTAKHNVEKEINIPKQTEKVFWLDFSSFELHLYQRVLETFKENRKRAFNNMVTNEDFNLIENPRERETALIESYFSNLVDSNCKLDEIDKAILDKVYLKNNKIFESFLLQIRIEINFC
jgi:SNF2 family DNA or RNA helicase